MWGDPGRFAHKHKEPQSATSDTSAATAVKPPCNLGFRCNSRVDQTMLHAASKLNIERSWHQALTMVLDHQRCERWQSRHPKPDFPGVDCKLGMCLSPRHVGRGRQHWLGSKGLDIVTRYYWLPRVGYEPFCTVEQPSRFGQPGRHWTHLEARCYNQTDAAKPSAQAYATVTHIAP